MKQTARRFWMEAAYFVASGFFGKADLAQWAQNLIRLVIGGLDQDRRAPRLLS